MEMPKSKEDLQSFPEKYREYSDVYNRMWAKLDAMVEKELEKVHDRIHNGEVLLPKEFETDAEN